MTFQIVKFTVAALLVFERVESRRIRLRLDFSSLERLLVCGLLGCFFAGCEMCNNIMIVATEELFLVGERVKCLWERRVGKAEGLAVCVLFSRSCSQFAHRNSL